VKRSHKHAGLQLLAFALVLFLSEQSVPFLYRLLPSDLKEWDRVTKRQEAIRTMEHQDVLFLGDSTGVQSIIPELFELITGQKAYNLSTYADRVSVADLALLQTYLDHHPPPKAIIDVRSILSWDMGYGFGLVRLQFNRADIANKLWHLGLLTPLEYGQLFLERVFPSLLYREKIDFVRRAFSDEKGYFENVYKRDEGMGWKGYEPFNPFAHNTNIELSEKNLEPFYRLIGTGGSLTMAPYSIPLLQELCDSAAARSTNFYVTFNPSAHVVQDNPRIYAGAQKIYGMAQQALAPNPSCALLPNIWIMDDPYLSDLTHTNHSGALVFTKIIANQYLEAERRKLQQ